MAEPTTLRNLVGLPKEPAALSESSLIMIDLQNTYTRGVMELANVQSAIGQAAQLLDRARSAGIPIFHIQHDDGDQLNKARCRSWGPCRSWGAVPSAVRVSRWSARPGR